MKFAKRHLFVLICFFILSLATRAQIPAGNQWVLDHISQPFWKFKIYQEGIYRINQNTLIQAGVPLTDPSFDPRKIQIFYNGEEIPVYVHGEQDGIFDANDYIELFCKKNNASIDSLLYPDGTLQFNRDYSMFTDTAYYFLSISNTLNNPRLSLETAVDFSNYGQAKSYFFAEQYIEPANIYAYGSINGYDMSDNSEFLTGEGWVGNAFGVGQGLSAVRDITFNTPGIYQLGPNATFDFCLQGRSRYSFIYPSYPGVVSHHVKTYLKNSTVSLTEDLYFGYGHYKDTATISINNLLLSGTNTISFEAIDDMTTNKAAEPNRVDRNTITYATLRYPHIPDLQNAGKTHMIIPDDPLYAKSYFLINNINHGSGGVIVYDLSNNRRIATQTSSGTSQFLVPNTLPGNDAEKHCYLTAESEINMVNALLPVASGGQFIDYYSDFQLNRYDYLIITHKSLDNKVQEYKDYRQFNGYPNLYNPYIAYIDELYEQFSFGIKYNPLSILHFLRYLYDNNVHPKHVFLIGKGYDHLNTRKNPTLQNKILIPSWGYPPSDNLLINKISENQYIPDITIGRLAAQNTNDIDIYLDKVIAYEDSLEHSNSMWQKRVIHLGGGTTLQEQAIIRNQLKKCENIIESPYFGGEVSTFLKKTTAPIEINTSEKLQGLINGGVKLITIYGHGTTSAGFDISTDEVKNYLNKNRYPLVTALSCMSGNTLTSNISKSEEFVLTPEKGAIAFQGSSGGSIIPALNVMIDTIYYGISKNYYGKTLGEIVRVGLRHIAIQQQTPNYISTMQQLSLHGDPALVIQNVALPDYKISTNNIYTTPFTISNEIDSFSVHIICHNTGIALQDTFALRIKRTFPDGIAIDTFLMKQSTAFCDTFSITYPVDKVSGIGLNFIEAEVDAFYQINESNEQNNSASYSFLIKSSGLIPVYPYEYAIVGNQELTLYASTSNPLSEKKRYVFQIDTDPAFTNPHDTYSVESSGGIISWKPTVLYSDSTVYYWRVSLDSTMSPDLTFDWKYSSFEFIDGEIGWGQSSFHQFNKNSYQYITQNNALKEYDFYQEHVTFSAQTGIYPNLALNEHYFAKNFVKLYTYSGIIAKGYNGGFVIAVFDTIALEPQQTVNNTSAWTGPVNNLQRPYTTYNAFEFPTDDTTWQSYLTNFINTIPNGNYVLAYSIKDHNAPGFIEPLNLAFESIGSSLIRVLPNNTPYIIFGRKGAAIGDPQWVKERAKTSLTDTINLTYQASTRWNVGHIKSTTVGPASHWKSLHWKQKVHPSDLMNTDSVRLEVTGVKADGSEDVLLNNILKSTTDVLQLDQIIDAAIYPTLQLQVYMSDDTFRTPSQMQYWRVMYDGVPESALDPATAWYFYNDTILQGDTLLFHIASRNISQYDMDSLLVQFRVYDGKRKLQHNSFQRLRPHYAYDTLIIGPVKLPTLNLASGTGSVWIETNPVNPATGVYDQIEQNHSNNLAEKVFFIAEDNENPLLDVTFDGIHILDGDIVSALPVIEIVLRDENIFKYMDQPEDTALFKIYLKYPSTGEFTPVYFMKNGVEQMIFYPSDGNKNSCKIVFHADFTGIDGEYMLLVEARDKSNNLASQMAYQTAFRVISESSVTEVMNWPNPFSTITHFVFTLTGAEIPTNFRIQIMTITGKVIRELDMHDLGPIHIGRNITSGGWDGTDQYGDRVANGVYLFRLLTDLNGEKIKKMSSGADIWVQQGWGKMYLIR